MFIFYPKALIDSQSNRGLLSSMMSWISPVLPITLLEIKVKPAYYYSRGFHMLDPICNLRSVYIDNLSFLCVFAFLWSTFDNQKPSSWIRNKNPPAY